MSRSHGETNVVDVVDEVAPGPAAESAGGPAAPGSRSGRPRRLSRMTLFLLPVAAFYAVAVAYPMVRVVRASMPEDDRFGHYRTLLSEPLYVDALVRTFGYAAVATVGALLVGYPLAYLMVRGRPWIRNVITVLVVVPFFVALLVRTFGWMLIFARNGPINRVLLELGIVDEPVRLVYTAPAVILGMTAVLLPFMVLPLTTVMRGIDDRLVQAARGLGASPPAAFFYVFLPLSLPGVLAGSVLIFMLGLGFFITPDLLGGSDNQVYPVLLNRQLQSNLGDPAFASAMSVVLLAAAFVVMFLASRIVPISSIWSPQVGGSRRRRRRGDGLSGSALASWVGRVGRLPRWLYAGPGYLLAVVGVLLCLLPMLAATAMSFQRSTFAPFPSSDLTLDWYRAFAEDARWIDAFAESLRLGVFVAVIVTLISTCTALAVVRGDFPFKNLVMSAVSAPLIVPHVALAFGLYLVLFQFRLDGTFVGVAIGHAIPAIPLVTIILISNLRAFDQRLEDAARGLGAKPLRAFLLVTFPLLRPGFLVAAFFGFLISLDELVFTLTLAGTRIRTLPLRLWEDLHVSLSPTLAVVSVVEMVLVILILGLSSLLLRRRRRRSGIEGSLL